jgi:hypothetical protein
MYFIVYYNRRFVLPSCPYERTIADGLPFPPLPLEIIRARALGERAKHRQCVIMVVRSGRSAAW